jgi:hypothetical protein
MIAISLSVTRRRDCTFSSDVTYCIDDGHDVTSAPYVYIPDAPPAEFTQEEEEPPPHPPLIRPRRGTRMRRPCAVMPKARRWLGILERRG